MDFWGTRELVGKVTMSAGLLSKPLNFWAVASVENTMAKASTVNKNTFFMIVILVVFKTRVLLNDLYLKRR